MGEEINVEINVEELERELRELESEKTIEIRSVAETTAVVAQVEEKSEIDLETLEKVLERAEAIAERKYLEKHGGLCHHVKLEKFSEPVTVCRSIGVCEDDEKLLVSLLYKYYPYASKTLRVASDIKPCRRVAQEFDVAMFADPVRLGVMYSAYSDSDNDEREAHLAYIYELDARNNGALGVYLKLAIRDGKPSITDVCIIDKPHSLVHSLLRMLRFPLVLGEEEEGS